MRPLRKSLLSKRGLLLLLVDEVGHGEGVEVGAGEVFRRHLASGRMRARRMLLEGNQV